ncbi:UPF0637 protein YktB [Kroppenstedtia guangzhouensis]|uniref:UPF0637 protein GCM10007416_01020 n=1 Tax=Kroppenstedtia guangzhouensis TaxID=1274356 RepID=A0ABQ1FYB9_9BACL|nr:DUF1054 domain-containing protein [Kroppenstedtia guangzhouensis]GGA32254.1 UPF0637 protein YktB [Kroppenstedtia guangzhouensis]
MQGFEDRDFDVFTIKGLKPRMEGLKERIRPKLKGIGETIAPYLSRLTGDEMYIHVAKHARRTVNPPDETWVAWSPQKRGYKSQPHFQVGIRETGLFAMFALIYEYPDKPGFAQNLLEQLDEILPGLPSDFVLSQDHTRPEVHPLSELGREGVEATLERLRNVKKAEFLCGRVLSREDPKVHDSTQLKEVIRETFSSLEHLYRLARLSL